MNQDQKIRLTAAVLRAFTVADLIAAHHAGIALRCYWYPEGRNAPRKLWNAVPDMDLITTARTIAGTMLGRNPLEASRVSCETTAPAGDPRSPVGSVVCGYERIQTYKWTTDNFSRRPIPPNSFAWRCIHTGSISLENPFLSAVNSEESA